MKWSWKIGRLAGIDVYVHFTFLLLVAWFGYIYWQPQHSLSAALFGVSFILLLFGCVVLHELGHALTARRYGIKTRHILLLPIGGVASLERMPEDPTQEILVALAGPVVNLVIALLLGLFLRVIDGSLSILQIVEADSSFLHQLLYVNIFLALFNLLPAFPMDGGRVLRALLGFRMSHNRATQVAATVGRGLALVFGFLGLQYNPFLILIAFFIWIGAGAEAGAEQTKAALGRFPVRRAMLTDFQTLSPDDSLAHVIELTLAGTQKDFPVVSTGEVVGVLGQLDLLRGLREDGKLGRVDSFMRRDVKKVAPDEPLQKIVNSLQSHRHGLLAVMDGGRIVGIVDIENLTELMQIQSMLQEHAR